MTITIHSSINGNNSGPRVINTRDGETPEAAATRFLIESWGYTAGFGWTEANEVGTRFFTRDGEVYNNLRKGGSIWFQSN